MHYDVLMSLYYIKYDHNALIFLASASQGAVLIDWPDLFMALSVRFAVTVLVALKLIMQDAFEYWPTCGGLSASFQLHKVLIWVFFFFYQLSVRCFPLESLWNRLVNGNPIIHFASNQLSWEVDMFALKIQQLSRGQRVVLFVLDIKIMDIHVWWMWIFYMYTKNMHSKCKWLSVWMLISVICNCFELFLIT